MPMVIATADTSRAGLRMDSSRVRLSGADSGRIVSRPAGTLQWRQSRLSDRLVDSCRADYASWRRNSDRWHALRRAKARPRIVPGANPVQTRTSRPGFSALCRRSPSECSAARNESRWFAASRNCRGLGCCPTNRSAAVRLDRTKNRARRGFGLRNTKLPALFRGRLGRACTGRRSPRRDTLRRPAERRDRSHMALHGSVPRSEAERPASYTFVACPRATPT